MQDDPLDQARFSYIETKTGTVHIYYQGRRIKSLKSKQASQFLNRIDHGSERDQQLVMAKVTGHFKHGNERNEKPRG